LTKGGVAHRVPVVDLAVLLLRTEDWDDDATARTVEETFRERFPMADEAYDRLFIYEEEEPADIFVAARPASTEYDVAIAQALVPDEIPAESVTEETPEEQEEPPEIRIEDDDE